MSRQSPFGFTFSMLIEIAAVVAIVSYLPRIDLRPSATAADVPQRVNGDFALQVPAALSTIRFSPPERAEAAPRETSFYQPRLLTSPETAPSAPRQSSREAPPLIAVDADRPQYVAEHLDRASQQLVNSVGSAVANAAETVLYIPPGPSPQAVAAASVAPPTIAPPRSRPPELSRYLPH
jgi:hypothetical protein